ncbi:MAG TPA: IS5 family transposase [Patescibacteria group bacterium]|nr:IS5 family transposase [Gammaproteobacteria bacterium]HWA52482.1 IS5 family transposase [Patescibacteria group bacterium]
MRRHELTDEQFKKIENMLPGREGHVGVTAQDNRLFINGVLWIFKTGAPWRDLPERYSHWKSVHRRFSRWSRAGIFDRIFRVLSEEADMEFLLVEDFHDLITVFTNFILTIKYRKFISIMNDT